MTKPEANLIYHYLHDLQEDGSEQAHLPVLSPSCDFMQLQFASPEKQRFIQNQRFLAHFRYLAKHSPFYQTLLKEQGITMADIRSLEDITCLPVTTKEDLNRNNMLFLAVEQHNVVDVCLTSATTGDKPTMLLQTASDLRRLAYNEEIAFATAGITAHDTMLICAALDRCFMAGLAYFLGGASLKARMVRGGAGSAAQLWELVKVTSATCLIGVPSLMRSIAEYAAERDEAPADTPACKVKKLIAIGEPVRDRLLAPLPGAKRAEELWQADILSTYASTELATTFAECPARQGGHSRPELIVVEIVDEQNRPVPGGEPGEIVVTPLGVTGMPLLRFKTGDISFLIDTPCACGRTTSRIGPVIGRKAQMLKYKGTTLFPQTLLAVIEGDSRFYGGCIEAHSNPDGTDRIIMYLALKTAQLTEEQIKNELRAKARVVPEIKIITSAELDTIIFHPEKRKRIQFIDLRGK